MSAEERLVQVGFAHNQAEAELIQGMLREEGIPSAERRARGFDVPDFLAAGPREILVPESAAEAAREVLSEVGGNGHEPTDSGDETRRFILGFAIAIALAAVLIWVLYELSS